MKVSVSDFEIHLASFLKDIASVMPSPIHKFAVGAFAAAKIKDVEAFLMSLADEEGFIDLDKAHSVITAGFASSGDTLVIPIPGVPLFGLQGVNFKFTKADADKFFAGFTTTGGEK